MFERTTKIAAEAAMYFVPEQITWLDSQRRAEMSERTQECYTRDLRDVGFALSALLGRTAATADLAEIGPTEIDAFVERWLADGTSLLTVLRRLAALRGFARRLTTNERLNCGGILAAQLPTTPKMYQQPIADENCQAVTAMTVPLNSWTRARDDAALLLQSDAGLTTAEVVGLDCKDVMRGTCTIAVAAVRPLRLAVVSSKTMVAVDLYASAAPFEWRNERPLFLNRRGGRLSVRSIQVSFRRRADAMGVARTATPMSLRHRAGHKMAAAGCTPAFVADRLGLEIHSVTRYFVAPRLRTVASVDRRPKLAGRQKISARRSNAGVGTRPMTNQPLQRRVKMKT